MRKLVLGLIMVICLSANSQTKKSQLFYENFGAVSVYQEKIQDEVTGINIITKLFFQDVRYTAISNVKFIFIHNKKDIELLISDLESALSFSKSGEKSVMEYGDRIRKYKVTADGGNGRITLWSFEDADGLTFVHPKKVVKLIEALNVIKDNYDK